MFYMWGLWVRLCFKNKNRLQEKVCKLFYCILPLLPYKKEKNKLRSECIGTNITMHPFEALNSSWDGSRQAWPPRQTFSFNRMLVGLQSTVFLILRGKKNVYKMQIVTQRCKLTVCLTVGMFWMINTQVLPVLNFLWSGVHLKCLITAALAANQMSGHSVRHMAHFSSVLLWRGSGYVIW